MSLTMEGLIKSLSDMKEQKNKLFQDLHQVIGAVSLLEHLVQQLLNPTAPVEDQDVRDKSVMDSEPSESLNGEAH